MAIVRLMWICSEKYKALIVDFDLHGEKPASHSRSVWERKWNFSQKSLVLSTKYLRMGPCFQSSLIRGQ